jgi:cytochrome c5
MSRFVAILALTAALAATSALAQKQPAPFAAGDAQAGKAIVDRDCVGCHAAKFAGIPIACIRGPIIA